MKAAWISLCLAASSAAWAQQYVISTVAGGAPPTTPALGLNLPVGTVFGVAADAEGNVYFASTDLHSVFRLDPGGVVNRIAGNSRAGYSGDGGPATSAQLNDPHGVAVDDAGNLFIADYGNRRIRRVSPGGVITTVVGSGACCFSGDGGPALSAEMETPFSLAVDRAGNLFVADLYGERVRKISPAGIITAAGDGSEGFSGDGGPATSAKMKGPVAVAVDGSGNLFVADCNNSRIRKVSADGIITTVVDNVRPVGLAFDGAGNLFIAEMGSIRKVSTGGIITTVAGGSWLNSGRDGGPATSAALLPMGVSVDSAGNLFIADGLGGGRIRKVTPDGIIHTVAGNGMWCCFSGDGGPATSAQLNDPAGIALDGAGNFYIADARNTKIRQVSPDGVITTRTYGCGAPDDYDAPCGVAVDAAGNLYVSDEGGVHRISPDGAYATVSATPSYGIAVDSAGSLYIADQFSCQIRRFSQAGEMTTVAGNRTCGHSGDGGPATAAQLFFPLAMAVDRAGTVYFVDEGSTVRIRRVSPEGIITTVAGGGSGELLDGGLATSGKLSEVIGLAADSDGSLYFQEFSVFYPAFLEIPRRVRKISPDGIVTTIAGTGDPGYSGDGGPAMRAFLNPRSDERGNNLAVDSAGNLYVADGGNNAVRMLRPVRESALTSPRRMLK